MKIVIVNPHMKIGGIASSLVNWATYIKTINKIDVKYVVFNKKINKKYTSFKEQNEVFFPERLSFYQLENYNETIWYCILKKTGILGFLKKKYTNKYRLKDSYDLAISYSNDIPRYKNNLMANDFVENSIKARYKVAWIHNDIEKLGFTRDYTLKRYKKFDAVVNVSKACKMSFDLLVPEYKHKSLIVRNAIVLNQVLEKSNEKPDFDFDKNVMNFVTVARIYNEQKRIDRILDIAERLKQNHLSFHWYILGNGGDLKWLKKSAKDRGINDCVSFLGFKSNPYPYIKMADYFVLTSDYEAQGMVLSEALCVGTPVISTDFEAAKEFILDCENGFIVEKSVDSFYILFKKIIENNMKMKISSVRYDKFENDFHELLLFLKSNKCQ